MECKNIIKNPTIVLISPQVIGAKNQVRKAQPPLGIAYLAGILLKNGYSNVHLLDAVVEDYSNIEPLEDDSNFIKYGLSDENVVKKLQQINPDLVGITSLFSSQAECAYSVAGSVKEAFPNIPILMGGNHTSYMYREILRGVPAVDYIIVGEGEYSFLDFVQKYFNKKDFYDVPGLAWRHGDEIRINPTKPFIMNLDELADPALHLYPMERYFEIGMPHNPFTVSDRVGSIMTSRGCPEACYFCSSPSYTGTQFRAMSARRTTEYIISLVENFKIEELQILDDTFTSNHLRVIEICEGIKHLGLRISLPNAIRGDRPLNHEKRLAMFKAMKEAGVVQFGMSVEHGDQEFLDSVVKKRLDIEEARVTCELAHEAGLLVHANFIMGFPFETQELRQKTIDFSKSLNADSFSVSLASPLPGTPMWDIVKKHNLFMPNFKVSRMVYVNVNIIPHDISPEDLKLQAETLNQELNKAAQLKSPETVEKYKRFAAKGKTANGDRKYSFDLGLANDTLQPGKNNRPIIPIIRAKQ